MKSVILAFLFSIFVVAGYAAINPSDTLKPVETLTNPGLDKDNCTFNGKPLYGRVKIVDGFADFKVKIVDDFPDIRVKLVDEFPTDCGRWKIVEEFPDFTIQIVDAFPDFRVKYVDSFPGTR